MEKQLLLQFVDSKIHTYVTAVTLNVY